MAGFEEFSRVYLSGGNMKAKDGPLQRLVVSRLLHLNAIAYGVVAGLLAGLGVFIVTIWLVIKGGEVTGPTLSTSWPILLWLRGIPLGKFSGIRSRVLSTVLSRDISLLVYTIGL